MGGANGKIVSTLGLSTARCMTLDFRHPAVDPYEEQAIFSLVVSDIKARSGNKGKIMSYIFKEYFDIPVSLFVSIIVRLERPTAADHGAGAGRLRRRRAGWAEAEYRRALILR